MWFAHPTPDQVPRSSIHRLAFQSEYLRLRLTDSYPATQPRNPFSTLWNAPAGQRTHVFGPALRERLHSPLATCGTETVFRYGRPASGLSADRLELEYGQGILRRVPGLS